MACAQAEQAALASPGLILMDAMLCLVGLPQQQACARRAARDMAMQALKPSDCGVLTAGESQAAGAHGLCMQPTLTASHQSWHTHCPTCLQQQGQ